MKLDLCTQQQHCLLNKADDGYHCDRCGWPVADDDPRINAYRIQMGMAPLPWVDVQTILRAIEIKC